MMEEKNNKLSRMHKRGDISVQMLVWVALSLVVLIIVIALVLGKVKFFNDNSLESCQTGCQYEEPDRQDCPDGSLKYYTSSCPDEKDAEGKITKKGFCCKKLI